MSKKAPKRKKNRDPFSDVANEPVRDNEKPLTRPPATSPARRWYLIGVFVLIAFGGTYLVQKKAFKTPPDVPRYTYKVIREYPHDATAFTQGLVLDDGYVWESTGKYDGQSSIRKVKLDTGEIVINKQLPSDEFGEGLAMVGDKLYQLTWKEEVCHVYDLELNKVKDFKYERHGWGLTYDGTHLIMSDGTARLHFIDPETFEEVRKKAISVRHGDRLIDGLNELEFAGGSIYANRLNWDSIYEIDPANGQVKSMIDLGNLWTTRPREGVLNGIAVDSKTKQVIVTGKYCPKIFEIELLPKQP